MGDRSLLREAIFTLAGTIIGAGIFAVPYFLARLGVGVALALLALAVLVNIWLSLAYLRVFLDTRSDVIEGAAERLLGARGALVIHALNMATVTLVMLIYVAGSASMLSDLASRLLGASIDARLLRAAVALSAAFIVSERPSGYARLVSSLTEILAALMVLVSIAALFSPPPVSCGYLAPRYPAILAWGPTLFSCLDALTMPNIYHILGDERETRKAIIGAYVIILGVYSLFIYSMVSVLGAHAADIIVKSLYCLEPLGLKSLGLALYTVGAVAVTLAMLTSLYNFAYLAGSTLEERWRISPRKASTTVALVLLASLLLPKSFAMVVKTLSTIAVTSMTLMILGLHVAAEAAARRLKPWTLAIDAIIVASVSSAALAALHAHH